MRTERITLDLGGDVEFVRLRGAEYKASTKDSHRNFVLREAIKRIRPWDAITRSFLGHAFDKAAGQEVIHGQ